MRLIIICLASLAAANCYAGINEWTYVGLAPEDITSIAVHPTNPDIIYASALDVFWDDTREGGLFKTTDHGMTWDAIGFRHSTVYDVALDPQHPETVWVANWDAGLWRSSDGGQTWENHSDGIIYAPSQLGPSEVAICPSDPMRLLVAIYDSENGASPAYRSIDGGMTWTQVIELGYGSPWYIQYDESANGLAYCYIAGTAGFAYSGDCGSQFVQPEPTELFPCHDLKVAPDTPGRLVRAAGSDGAWWSGGVWVSSDSGQTWSQPVEGFDTADSAVVGLAPIGGGADTLVMATRAGAFIRFSTGQIVPMLLGWEPELPPGHVYAIGQHQLGEIWGTLADNGIFTYTYMDSTASTPQPRTTLRSGILIYPNPARGDLTVSLGNNTPLGCDVRLYNVLGQIVLRQAARPEQQIVTLTIPSALAGGTYFLGVMPNPTSDRSDVKSLSKIIILK